jgi:purine nucleoside permease
MPTLIHLVLLAAFEPDTGPIPGELTLWLQSHSLHTRLDLPAAYRPLYTDGAHTLALATGVGAARAAASVMALGLDSRGQAPRFDLTQAYFLITGVAGISPHQGSLASVVLPEYVVDGDLTHELDAREIPQNDPAWPDGFVPIGKSTPYEQPRADRFNGDDGLVFQLSPRLVTWAHTLTHPIALQDTEALATRRQQFSLPSSLIPLPSQTPPQVQRGDELSSSTFFHGRLMSERAARTVAYQTERKGTYAITAMEDAGILQALKNLAAAGRVDWNRILIVRAASNFDQQRPGLTAAESLAETRVATHSAYRPALENAHRAGSVIADALLAGSPSIPGSAPGS